MTPELFAKKLVHTHTNILNITNGNAIGALGCAIISCQLVIDELKVMPDCGQTWSRIEFFEQVKTIIRNSK